jgi:hypothetical protein
MPSCLDAVWEIRSTGRELLVWVRERERERERGTYGYIYSDHILLRVRELGYLPVEIRGLRGVMRGPCRLRCCLLVRGGGCLGRRGLGGGGTLCLFP